MTGHIFSQKKAKKLQKLAPENDLKIMKIITRSYALLLLNSKKIYELIVKKVQKNQIKAIKLRYFFQNDL